jgi:hypothetical protein
VARSRQDKQQRKGRIFDLMAKRREEKRREEGDEE